MEAVSISNLFSSENKKKQQLSTVKKRKIRRKKYIDKIAKSKPTNNELKEKNYFTLKMNYLSQ